VKDADSLDQLFDDMFRNYTPGELAVIKAKYGTEGDVLDAPMLIEAKARDIVRHYVGVVMPEGFKAQVVASTRSAAVTYREKLLKARDELVTRLEALDSKPLLWERMSWTSSTRRPGASFAPIRCSASCGPCTWQS